LEKLLEGGTKGLLTKDGKMAPPPKPATAAHVAQPAIPPAVPAPGRGFAGGAGGFNIGLLNLPLRVPAFVQNVVNNGFAWNYNDNNALLPPAPRLAVNLFPAVPPPPPLYQVPPPVAGPPQRRGRKRARF
jgi:hypothetical protein